MMRKAALFFILLVLGCARHSGYSITMMHPETKHKELSGQWFTREIYGEFNYTEKGFRRTGRGLAAVELVYCPIVAGEPTPPVCRTAVIYNATKNPYVEPLADKIPVPEPKTW